MIASEFNSMLRNSIKNEKLRIMLEKIWVVAEEQFHPFQVGSTDQSFSHCLRVETNIWALLFKKKIVPTDLELFILSAASALHDIGKMINVKKTEINKDHGEVASRLLLEKETWLKIGFQNKFQAEAVSKIISVHDNGNINSLPDGEYCICNPPGVFLRDLAAIFRLADMLDTTESRSPYLSMSLMDLGFSGTIGLWLARSSLGHGTFQKMGRRSFSSVHLRTKTQKLLL